MEKRQRAMTYSKVDAKIGRMNMKRRDRSVNEKRNGEIHNIYGPNEE